MKKLAKKVIFKGYVKPKELPKITAKASIGLNLLENKSLNYYYSLANKAFDYIQAEIPAIHMDFPEYRQLNQTYEVLLRQIKEGLRDVSASDMKHITIAYEPVWAIGTGRTASPEQAQSAHAFLRERLGQLLGRPAADRIRLQYGGSVKPENAAQLKAQPDIDGALVGGASLDPQSFYAILSAGSEPQET